MSEWMRKDMEEEKGRKSGKRGREGRGERESERRGERESRKGRERERRKGGGRWIKGLSASRLQIEFSGNLISKRVFQHKNTIILLSKVGG